MTNKETLKNINEIEDILVNNFGGYSNSNQKYFDALDEASNALEKQIPKEPLDIGNDWGLYCPTCSSNDGEIFQIVGRKEDGNIKPMFRYCPDCGQRIKWKND